jgi:thiamine pyrophosphate-dependent acetolactate synthase large subunit-like protein
VTVAGVIADTVRRAGVARVFTSDDADAVLAAALASAYLPLIRVREGADACAMASVTGRLGGVPGLALIGRDDAHVQRALAAARRACAPAIVMAGAPPSSDASVKALAAAGPESAAHWAAHAIQAAAGEPPGPVWLTVPPDAASRAAVPVATALRASPSPVDAASMSRAAAAIAAASRPLIVAGRECRAPEAAPWLRALAEALPAPVLLTPASRGALPEPHPLCFGMLRADAGVLGRADLVIALGVDEEEVARAAVTLRVPVTRLGVTPPWTSGRADVSAEASGAVPVLLEELAPRLRGHDRADWDVAELDRIRRASAPPPVDPALVSLVTRLREATPVGTAAVFASALHEAAWHWQAVTPGEVSIDDRPVAAAAAVALARGDQVVLAFPESAETGHDLLRDAEGRVVVVAPSRSGLGHALDVALDGGRACVVIVPPPVTSV